MIEKRKRGRPVTHPRVICHETREIFDTYKAAAEAVGGSKYGVMRCVKGRYKTHKKKHFSHVEN